MEAELTEIDSRPDNLEVSEFASVYEAIPIDFRKEQSTEEYKATMSKDINNIDTYETRTKVNTKKWRPIDKVIDEAYIKDSKTFSDDFIKECKNYSNEAHYIPHEVKNNIKRTAMEQGLYEKVVKLRRNDLKFVAIDKNKNEAKFKFQGLSARSQRWFDLDLYWIEVNFITREPDFYKKIFKSMMIYKILIHSETFKFQLEMQNVWNHLSFKIMPQFSGIVRNH